MRLDIYNILYIIYILYIYYLYNYIFIYICKHAAPTAHNANCRTALHVQSNDSGTAEARIHGRIMDDSGQAMINGMDSIEWTL